MLEKIYSRAYSRKQRPSSNMADGIVREDYHHVIAVGLAGIHEAARGAPLVLQRYVHTAKPFPAVYKGHLGKSFRFRLLSKGATVQTRIGHSEIMEVGKSPGKMPPYKPIARWVADKIGAPRSFIKDAEKISFAMLRHKKKNRAKAPFSKMAKRKGIGRKRNLYRFASIVAGLRNKIKHKGIDARGYAKNALKELADITLYKVMQKIDAPGTSSALTRLPNSGSFFTNQSFSSTSFRSVNGNEPNTSYQSSSYDVKFK